MNIIIYAVHVTVSNKLRTHQGILISSIKYITIVTITKRRKSKKKSSLKCETPSEIRIMSMCI